LIAESLGPLSEELRAMTNWEAVCRAAYDHVRKRTIRGRVVVLGPGGEFFFASDGFLVSARPQVEPSDGEWRRYHEAQKLESDDATRPAAASSFLEIAAATKDRRLRMTAPDGRRLAIGAFMGTSEFWVMENFWPGTH
jgi:hypothetical protein